MEFVREHRLSQEKGADLVGVSRYEMFDLMTKYHVPVIDFTSEELKTQLQKPLPSGIETITSLP